MNILQIILIPIFSIVVLYVLSRLIGYRQMSQLSLFDYVNGITIGSIASELAVSPLKDTMRPFIALVIYGIFTLIFAVLSDKSIKVRRTLTGKPIFLISAGKFYEDGFSKARLDLSEFMIQCRTQGYFDVSQIDTAIMEPNGAISILPKSQNRPVNTSDMNYVIPQEEIPANVIMDGKIMAENLKNKGFEENWLNQQMSQLNYCLDEIFLCICTRDGQLTFFKKEGKMDSDIFS